MACRRLYSRQVSSAVQGLRLSRPSSQPTAAFSLSRATHSSQVEAAKSHSHRDGGRRRRQSSQSSGSRFLKPILLCGAAIPLSVIDYSDKKDGKSKEEEVLPPLPARQRKELLQKADEMHKVYKYQEEYELLFPHHMTKDTEVLWRLARVSILCRPFAASMHPLVERMTKQAFHLAAEAQDLRPDCAMCQLWYGITLNHLQVYRSSDLKLQDVGRMYAAFTKAVELNPRHAYAWHSLGSWHYHVADVSWLTWKALEYANPNMEKGSFERARECLERAEETEPGFYLGNLHYLADTYEKLKLADLLEETLHKMVRTKPDTDSDVSYIQVASDRLNKIKKKRG